MEGTRTEISEAGSIRKTLSLRMAQVQDIFAEHKITDADISVTCPICTTTQTLNECKFETKGKRTTYTCKNGCQVLTGVYTADNGLVGAAST